MGPHFAITAVLSLIAAQAAATEGPNSPATRCTASETADCAPIERQFGGEGTKARAVAFAKFGPRVLTYSDDSVAQLWDGLNGELIGEPMQLGGKAARFHFSDDGERMVSTAATDRIGGQNGWADYRAGGSARLWDMRTGALLGEPIPLSAAPEEVIFSADANAVAILTCAPITAREGDLPLYEIGARRRLAVVSLRNGERIGAPYEFDGGPNCEGFGYGVFAGLVSHSPLLTVAPADGVRLIDLRSARNVAGPFDRGDLYRSPKDAPPAFASDNLRSRYVSYAMGLNRSAPRVSIRTSRILIDGAADGARLYDLGNKRLVGGPYPSGGPAVLSPDGRQFLIGCAAGDVEGILLRAKAARPRLYDFRTGRMIAELSASCLLRTGKRLEQTFFSLWPTAPVTIFSADSRRIAVSTPEFGLQIWNAKSGTRIGAEMSAPSPIIDAEFSPRGDKIVTVSLNGTVRLWEARTGRQIGATLGRGRSGGFNRPAQIVFGAYDSPQADGATRRFSADGRRVVTVAGLPAAAWAQIWSTEKGEPVGQSIIIDDGAPLPRELIGAFDDVAASDRTGLVAAASRDRLICIWSISNGDAIAGPIRATSGVNNLAFDSSGAYLAASTFNGIVIWNVARLIEKGSGAGCPSGPAPAPVYLEDRYTEAIAKARQDSGGARILVVGGQAARPGEYESVGAFLSHMLCSGSLIGPRIMLTAAHCVDPSARATSPPTSRAIFGLTIGAGAEIAVIDAKAHPSFDADSERGADVALVRLSDRAPANPVALAPDGWIDAATVGRIIGFGKSEDNDRGGQKRWADAPIVSGRCDDLSTDGRRAATVWGCQEGMELVAANLDAPGADTCKGDSGGPLLVGDPAIAGTPAANDADAYALGAVTSRSVQSLSFCGVGGVYVRLTPEIRAWIAERAAAWGEPLASN